MSASLQPGEQDETWNAGGNADDEIPHPARCGRDVAGTEREYRTRQCKQRGQQGVLRGRMERIAAKRRKIRDKDYGSDAAGKIFGSDGESKPRNIPADNRLPCEGEDGHGLQDAADPEAGRHRQRARDETTSKATGNCRSKSDALDDGGE